MAKKIKPQKPRRPPRLRGSEIVQAADTGHTLANIGVLFAAAKAPLEHPKGRQNLKRENIVIAAKAFQWRLPDENEGDRRTAYNAPLTARSKDFGMSVSFPLIPQLRTWVAPLGRSALCQSRHNRVSAHRGKRRCYSINSSAATSLPTGSATPTNKLRIE